MMRVRAIAASRIERIAMEPAPTRFRSRALLVCLGQKAAQWIMAEPFATAGGALNLSWLARYR